MSDERRVVQEAVLMLDLVGSSVVAAKFGDAKAAEVKAALDSLVRRAVAACNGAFIKDTGDGHFVTFEHELDATRCAIATLSALETHNRETGPRQSKWRPEFELHVRVGITFGELHVDRHGDRQGNTANLSARFEALKPEALICLEGGMAKEEFEELAQDRVLVDWCVRDGIMDEFGAFVTFVGAFKPKGVGTLEEVYLLDWRDAPHVDLPPRDDEPPRNLPQAGPARALRPNLPPPERFELRGIDWYCEEDRHYLHGRAEDVAQVRGLLANCAVVRLTGPSGVGKSSLLRAALAPALREIGWRVAVIRPMRHPAVQLLRELSVELLTEGSPTFAEPLEPGLLRAEIAHGKAYGALAMGMGSRALFQRAQEQSFFVGAVNTLAQGRMVPVPGGVLILDQGGALLGAVGVSGDTSDNDETCAIAGIEAAGLKANPG